MAKHFEKPKMITSVAETKEYSLLAAINGTNDRISKILTRLRISVDTLHGYVDRVNEVFEKETPATTARYGIETILSRISDLEDELERLEKNL